CRRHHPIEVCRGSPPGRGSSTPSRRTRARALCGPLRKTGMSLAGLIDVINSLEDVFGRLQLRRSYGGAIAYNYYAPPRLTQDVDVLALVPDTKVPGEDPTSTAVQA